MTSISREEVDGCDKYTDVSASKRDQALFLHPQPPKLSWSLHLPPLEHEHVQLVEGIVQHNEGEPVQPHQPMHNTPMFAQEIAKRGTEKRGERSSIDNFPHILIETFFGHFHQLQFLVASRPLIPPNIFFYERIKECWTLPSLFKLGRLYRHLQVGLFDSGCVGGRNDVWLFSTNRGDL